MTAERESRRLLYEVTGKIATITLNRPEQLNTIVPPMPAEVQAVWHRAVRIRVSGCVVRGAGRSFCAGVQLGGRLSTHSGRPAELADGKWDPGKDFMFATADGSSADPAADRASGARPSR